MIAYIDNRVRISYLLGIIILFCYSIVYFFNPKVSSDSIHVLGVWAFVQFCYSIYSWHKIHNVWFDAYLIFTIALYAFMLGQPILEGLDLSVSYRRLWNGSFNITSNGYYTATYYSMVSTLFFHFGSIIGSIKSNIKISQQTSLSFDKMTKVAWFLVIVSLPFYIYLLILQVAVIKTIGYAGLYDWEAYTPRSIMLISDIFTPSMLAVFCSSLLKKKHQYLTSIMVIFLIFLPPFYLGGRSNAMICMAVFLLLYSCINRLNIKHYLLIVLSGAIMLFAMNIVGKIRSGSDRSLQAVQGVIDDKNENPICQTIEEMGWSMFPTIKNMEAVPKHYDYSYGTSYFWAIVSIIPNIGFWETHPGMANDPGTKLGRYVNLGYGMGYSIVAGTYNEFGYFGVVLMFIYGLIFCRIFSFISPNTAVYKPVEFVLALMFLWFSIKFIRNSYDSMVRSIAFYIVPIYFLSKKYGKYKFHLK